MRRGGKRSVIAYAPATVANLAVGFDILGLALEGVGGIGEWVSVEKLEGTRQIVIDPVEGYPDLPLEPARNCASAGLLRMQEELGLGFGFRLRLRKRIPLGSGLGGSAASAVAGVVAAQGLLPLKLSEEELLRFALVGEAVASGAAHADNVGPCLRGGLTLVRVQEAGAPKLESVKFPSELRVVILLPSLRIDTREARRILSPHVKLEDAVAQTQNLATFLLGCERGDLRLLGGSLEDRLIEPQRARLIPRFPEFKALALESGALGFSISGSGPAMFALCAGVRQAAAVHKSLTAHAKRAGVALVGCWSFRIARRGARLEGRSR